MKLISALVVAFLSLLYALFQEDDAFMFDFNHV